MELTWDRVLAWRMRRQFLDRPANTSTVPIVERLCGVQAQVASAAEYAVAVRRRAPRKGEVARALADRELVKTWAMRGTLHLLTPAAAPAFLSLLASSRYWERGPWQRTFATAAQMAAIADAAGTALDGAVLTREELTAAIVAKTSDPTLREHLVSGWGALFKPLAVQGLLVNGPGDGNRVTFTRPDTYLDGWPGLPEPDVAARQVIPAYLDAYGPASIATFDQWLMRGVSKKAALRGWFRDLVDAGTVVEVRVEGAPLFVNAESAAGLAAAHGRAFEEVRLLPAFDQFVLGPGTGDTRIIAAQRRKEVSRAAGWIAPVVVYRGRVAGTWELKDGAVRVVLFTEAEPVPRDGIEAETARLAAFHGAELTTAIASG